MTKQQRTKAELEVKLDEQVELLKSSANAFDDGRDIEAFRLASTLRLLLHDTKQSHSLLGQLNLLDRRFWDTSWPTQDNNALTTESLVSIIGNENSIRYVAHLDDTPFKQQVAFKSWWNNSIFIDKQQRILSRRDLVLITANQDGGTHVDPKIDERYADLEDGKAMGWQASIEDNKIDLGKPGRVALRQIAHEVLKTLIPNYEKEPDNISGILIGGASVTSADNVD